jgi:hypothetical protein
MASIDALMGIGSIIQGAGTVASSIFSYQAFKQEARFQQSQMEFNARLAEVRARDAIDRGEESAKKLQQRANALKGSQRALYAGQGVEVDSGSASEVQQDTMLQAAEDIRDIRNNAWREAWGYRMDAVANRGQGVMAGLAGVNNANSTLLTGIANASAFGQVAAQYGVSAYSSRVGVSQYSSPIGPMPAGANQFPVGGV